MNYKVTKTINSAPPSAGTFSDSIYARHAGTPGLLNVSVYGATFVAVVTLQRAFDDGTTWLDVDAFTVNEEAQIYDVEAGVKYRIGVKNAEFTSGSVAVRLSR